MIANRLSRPATRRLVVAVLIVWVLLGFAGYFIGEEMAPSSATVWGGIVGALFGSFVWVLFCWTLGFVVRRQLNRRSG